MRPYQFVSRVGFLIGGTLTLLPLVLPAMPFGLAFAVAGLGLGMIGFAAIRLIRGEPPSAQLHDLRRAARNSDRGTLTVTNPSDRPLRLHRIEIPGRAGGIALGVTSPPSSLSPVVDFDMRVSPRGSEDIPVVLALTRRDVPPKIKLTVSVGDGWRYRIAVRALG